ncbi:zinc fingers and homeoboxes protein 3-like isoform X2 [Brienomyrus brachyistius]|nr:zinc fingers and homeoboxes protein 3-like isoform X2 [Brienomyrus brachyistius]
MASKRKSTIPCMIPAKAASMSDGQGHSPAGCFRLTAKSAGFSLPTEKVATTTWDSKEEGSSSSPERGALRHEADSYGCQPCRFESQDLNLFLDHVYSSHPDFRAEPSFHCLDCGVTTRKFEGLALHNARAHPSTATTTLQVRKRDWRMIVEQSLVSGGGPTESEISITKTPIMRMMKGKGEHKKIVVSHVPDEASPAAGNEAEVQEHSAAAQVVPTGNNKATQRSALPATVPVVNGSSVVPVLKVPVGQVVHNWAHLQKSSPVVSSSHSSSSDSSSKNLPKVMIPLCSIPTYDAAMDTSSFLKTSFSKFPYPTKAELCYLTVVTNYPEEQIKIWFTAQRLKQGISWSPEEIEDSRRKMFSTIIKPPSPQLTSSATTRQSSQAQLRPSHNTQRQTQTTVTVMPTTSVPGSVSHVLQGKSGVIVSQPVVSNGIQVGGGPVTLAVTPKPNIGSGPQMQAKPAAALVADKGLGVVVSVVGSSSSSSGSCIVGSGTRTSSIISSTMSTSNSSGISSSNITTITNNDTSKMNSSTSSTSRLNSSTDGRVIDLSPLVPGSSHSSRMLPSSFLDPSFYKSKKSQEQLGALKQSFTRSQFPEQEEVERLTRITGLTVREVRKWFSDRRYHNRNLKGLRSGDMGLLGKGSVPDFADSLISTENPKAHRSSVSPPILQPELPSPSPDHSTHRKEQEVRQMCVLEANMALDPHPAVEDLVQLQTKAKKSGQAFDEWSSEQHKKPAPEKKKEEASTDKDMENDRVDTVTKKAETCKAPALIPGAPSHTEMEDLMSSGPGAKPKVDPIKINLKMLKVTEASGQKDLDDGMLESQSLKVSSHFPCVSTITPTRGKKTPQQMHMLKQVFARTQWPGSVQYDQLVALTGLPRPEVVRWFGDSRYVYKNGQLKWLEAYQRAMLEEEEVFAEEEESRRRDEAPGDHSDTQGTTEGDRSQGIREDPSLQGASVPTALRTEPVKGAEQAANKETKKVHGMAREMTAVLYPGGLAAKEDVSLVAEAQLKPCKGLSGGE